MPWQKAVSNLYYVLLVVSLLPPKDIAYRFLIPITLFHQYNTA